MSPLFINGSFQAHSGKELPYKINCDVLHPYDIKTIAAIIGRRWRFSSVHGIPTGGARLEEALKDYISADGPALIVDDVLTTGGSMEEKKRKLGGDPIGIVIFARGPHPAWIHPLFQLAPWAVE